MRTWMIVGAACLFSSATALAQATGTLSLALGPPEIDGGEPGGSTLLEQAAQVALSWTVTCPGVTSPLYAGGAITFVHTADTTVMSDVNYNLALQRTPGPITGTVNLPVNPGQKIHAAFLQNAVACGPSSGTTGGGPNASEIDSNDQVYPPYVDQGALDVISSQSVLQAGEAFGPGTGLLFAAVLDAAPVGSETVTVAATGAGVSFSQTFTASDWKAQTYLMAVQGITPTQNGTISFTLTLNPYSSVSNTGTVTVGGSGNGGGGGDGGSGSHNSKKSGGCGAAPAMPMAIVTALVLLVLAPRRERAP